MFHDALFRFGERFDGINCGKKEKITKTCSNTTFFSSLVSGGPTINRGRDSSQKSCGLVQQQQRGGGGGRQQQQQHGSLQQQQQQQQHFR